MRDLSYMFNGCDMEEIDLSSRNISKVERMTDMFKGSKLKSVFEVNKVD